MSKSRDFVITESMLAGKKNLDDLLSHYRYGYENFTLPNYLAQLLQEKKMGKSGLHLRTQMGRTYIYQIFSGKRHPSRDKLLQIAMALRCSLEETQTLLLLSEHAPLSLRQRRDLIIAYCLIHRMDSFDLNACLYDSSERPLFNDQ